MANESRYLTQFRKLKEEGSDSFVLVGDCLLVEQIKLQEVKTASGIVLSTEVSGRQRNTLAQDKPHFVRVLAVGNGYYDDETKETIPLEVEPGDIILVGPLSVKYFSLFGDMTTYESDSIGITREAEIQMRFKGQEGYDQAFAILNRYAKKQVAETGGTN